MGHVICLVYLLYYFRLWIPETSFILTIFFRALYFTLAS